jgi:SAM-dependent methyltransferase
MRPARDDRHVYLAMPSYGDISAAAARSFYRASRLPDHQKTLDYREGSLLAANFNSLWCNGLNAQRMGGRVDYWGMQHGDVAAPDWWLDELIDELEERDLDVLGVAVPIKDDHGLTSIALGRHDGSTWRIHCRLTMTELQRLPETFTSDDVGYPLLLNTGLWVCRFDPDWNTKLQFTINDRIVQGPDGNYFAECEPEDWYFSRLLHELGLKVGCTRKIPVQHKGPHIFRSDRVWGEPFDSAYVAESVLPRPAFELPEVAGWLRPDEGQALAELVRGLRVLEIGSYFGLSTVVLAREAEHVVTLDTHDGRGTAVPQNTLPAFQVNLARNGVSHKVTSLIGTVDDVDLADHGPFDVAYIDGGHDRASVEADTAAALAVLKPGGLLAYHDYASEIDRDVREVVDAMVARGAEVLSVIDSLAVVRPPAAQLLEV